MKEGPAEILTVVEGQQVERFTVEIVHVSKQDAPATKGMVLRITDPRLLKKTGGIVQGMSGSPIVQDGKLIGAVTHVFVNDLSRDMGALSSGCFKIPAYYNLQNQHLKILRQVNALRFLS